MVTLAQAQLRKVSRLRATKELYKFKVRRLCAAGINLVLWILTSLIVTKPKLIKRNLSKRNEIDGIVEKRFKEEIK